MNTIVPALDSAKTAFEITQPRLRLPVVHGLIDRRILVNFRADPAALRRMLPPPFEPNLIQGWGMAGICLIRLREIRPVGIPRVFGIQSENAAHRIAVEWTERGQRRKGVFIPRRDTSSWLNRQAGGRLFPGEHHAADFHVIEGDNRYLVEMKSRDEQVRVRIAARVADALPSGSVFRSLAEASAFFETGALGWSVTKQPRVFDGLELRSFDWRIEPLSVEEVESSFFANPAAFPPGSAQFDSALLMRGLRHEWHGGGRMSVDNRGETER